MAFFCSKLLTFILRKRRNQEVFLFSPHPGLRVSTHPYPYLVFPPLDGRTVCAPVLAQSLFPSFCFLRDLLYTYPFSFTASDFLFYVIPVSMQTPVSKKVCVPCDLPLCLSVPFSRNTPESVFCTFPHCLPSFSCLLSPFLNSVQSDSFPPHHCSQSGRGHQESPWWKIQVFSKSSFY